MNGGLSDCLIYSDGIDLLVDYFSRENICYNIYECETPEEAFEHITNPQVTSLWVFGHGNMCTLSFAEED